MEKQSGGALTWSVAVHWVRWPWGFLGGAGQGHLCFPPPVFCLRPPCLSNKQSEMAAPCAGLGDSQAKSSCESMLTLPVLGLGLTEARCCFFERI